ncbi:MAG: efflux RND transporter periplasmic adaptor subunit [Verrucomicrobiales bacterium]
MKFLKVIVPPIIVLALAMMVSGHLKRTKPEPVKRSRTPVPPSVEAIRVSPGSYQISIPTRGEVRARTRSVLIPEVSGRIDSISPNFRDGGFFEKDEILAEIDPRDYETATTVAAGRIAEARNAYAQEIARAAQAKENWERLGQGGEANDLVLRIPQLAEAKARVDGAIAQHEQAQTDLERTKIRAPYAGRILEQLVDVGQFVTNGTSLARIFAVDFAEVRLPLTNQQSGFIDLPEDYRGSPSEKVEGELPTVSLTKKQGLRTFEWEGKIVRTEGAIDTRSRQLFVIAQVEDPYAKSADGTPPLKIDDFVEARITGRLLQGVYTLPRTAIRGGKVLVIDAENRLRIRDIEIVWRDDENVIVNAGLEPDEIVCTTPPAYATEGAVVRPSVAGASPEPTPMPDRRGGSN